MSVSTVEVVWFKRDLLPSTACASRHIQQAMGSHREARRSPPANPQKELDL